MWINATDSNKFVDTVYIDFSKAFDTVSHRNLLHKLPIYGITGNILQWFSSFPCDRKQRVKRLTSGNCELLNTSALFYPMETVIRQVIYTTKIDGVVCPPNISETFAGRLMKLAHRQSIASTTIKLILKKCTVHLSNFSKNNSANRSC